ncbi:GGDEF domain-containing protein [Deinococcus koreensis]|uniref:GGDEF domain-containing protein n=1 Tax=Deinococcus koreensis TaxID=2054903 RepID=A0A2K3UUM0_9DEIO|nr:sensor domain-containing diguanylate cyclase [Deinococcus koreensis]PNY80232.1 hypothetical protein CVO96_01635 [Deinococcus koreensis]
MSRAIPPPDPTPRTLTPTQALQATFRSRLLLLFALLLTQVLTVSAVLWGERQNAERAVQASATASLDQLVRVTADNIRSYMQSATQIVSINSENIRAGQLSAGDPSGLSVTFQTMLDVMPQLNGVLIGHPDGRFVFVRRDGPDDSGRFVRVIETRPARTVLTTRLDARGVVTDQSAAPDPYDPRTRPWYRQAVARPGEVVWTAPYVFASSRQPGITVARALPDAPGGPVVLGADVQLRNLAVFLKGVQITPHGRAFVTDSAGHAIATSRDWPVSIRERVPTLEEVADPALRVLLGAGGTGRLSSGNHRYSVDGQRYTAVVKPVQLQPGVRWLVGVYAPESDFSLGLQPSNRVRVISIALACLLSALLAWPLLARAVRPMSTLQHQATTDPLTGLRNRASFLAQLDEALSRPRDTDPGRCLGVAIFDLDGFKQINDRYGHAAGDEVLLAVGARMLAAVRPGDTLGRLGGDEFALLAVGASREEVRLRVEGVLAALIRRPVVVGEQAHPVRATAGLSFHDPAEPLTEPHPRTTLMARADAALIAGKQREKGRVWVAGESTLATIFL